MALIPRTTKLSEDTLLVAVEGYINASTTIGTSETQITNLLTTDDSHGTFALSTFTAEQDGRYLVDVDFMFNIQAYASAGTISLFIRKGGTTIKYARSSVITQTCYVNLKTSRLIKLLAGETISFYGSKEAGLTTVFAHNDNLSSRFSIVRVGNY